MLAKTEPCSVLDPSIIHMWRIYLLGSFYPDESGKTKVCVARRSRLEPPSFSRSDLSRCSNLLLSTKVPASSVSLRNLTPPSNHVPKFRSRLVWAYGLLSQPVYTMNDIASLSIVRKLVLVPALITLAIYRLQPTHLGFRYAAVANTT